MNQRIRRAAVVGVCAIGVAFAAAVVYASVWVIGGGAGSERVPPPAGHYYTDDTGAVGWCPEGWTDIQCGA